MPPKRKRLVPQSKSHHDDTITSIVVDTNGECITVRELIVDTTPSPKRLKPNKSQSYETEKEKKTVLFNYSNSRVFTVDPADVNVSVLHKWTIHRIVSCYYLLHKLYSYNRDVSPQPDGYDDIKNNDKKYPERYDMLDHDQTFISICYDILEPHSVITPVSSDSVHAIETDSKVETICKEVVFYLLTMILSIHNMNNSHDSTDIITGATLTNKSGSKKSYYYQGDIILLQIAKYFSIDNDTSILDNLRDILIEKIHLLFKSDNAGVWYLYILEVSRAFFALMNTPDLINYIFKLVKCLLYNICIKSITHTFPLQRIKLPRDFFYDIPDISKEFTSIEDKLAVNVTVIFLNNQRKLYRNLGKFPQKKVSAKTINSIDTSALDSVDDSDQRKFELIICDLETIIHSFKEPNNTFSENNTKRSPVGQVDVRNTPFIDATGSSFKLTRNTEQVSVINGNVEYYSKWLGECWDDESVQKSLHTSKSIMIVQNNFRLVPRMEIPQLDMTIKNLIDFVSGIYLKQLIREYGTQIDPNDRSVITLQPCGILDKELETFKTLTKKFISKEKHLLSLFAKKYLRRVRNSTKLYISYIDIESCEQPQYHRNYPQNNINNTNVDTNTTNSSTVSITDISDKEDHLVPYFGLHTLGDTPIDLLRKILKFCKDSQSIDGDAPSDSDSHSDCGTHSDSLNIIMESIQSYLSTNTKKKK